MQGELMMAAPMAAQPHIQAGPRTATGPHRRSGFTLVELLVVLLIVGMLAAILTPVVMQSLAKARNAAIKSEIDMLHMAIMNYKNEYGSFPPCIDTPVGGGSGLVARHVQRLFPRAAPAVLPGGADINPATALVGWLAGYTENPVDPVGIGTGGKRNKLYDFDQPRVAGMLYHPTQKPNAPYIYIDNTHYADATGTPIPFAAVGGPYAAEADASGVAFHPETFQILCAGRDEQWGTDDDVSNFWPGTRGEYVDSLNN
ncbi:MAG: prepilin-type N-terminal cleavage/methylation domain-containing protein [Planctomycetota bacterium]|nr:prepilin-type N-terminal cleavage/methylation domain-containing protein [Planctomycetota bacterium]